MQLSKIWIDLFRSFDKKKIFYWLDWGTLLGAIRDKKIFDWDHDIDVSVHYKEINKILIILEKYKKLGFSIVIQKNLPYLDNIIQVYPPKNKGEKFFPKSLDIYIYKKYNNNYVMRWLHQPQGKFRSFFKYCIAIMRKLNRAYLSNPNYTIKNINLVINHILLSLLMKSNCRFDIIPGKFFEQFTKISFYGMEFNTPRLYKGYLEYLYGKNWTKPDPNWNWRKGNPKKKRNASLIPKPKLDDDITDFYK